MFDLLIEMFSYTFFVRALFVGLLISLCTGLLGNILVLKRYSMVGDGLSHVGFGAMAIASVLNITPTLLAIPVVILNAFLLLKINENSKIRGDALIGITATGALAIGVTVISLKKGVNTDFESYMFGSILAISKEDLYFSILLCITVLFLFILFYNRIFSVTFDENFAKAVGININRYNALIAILTSVTIVLGMRIMGTLLISGLIIFPTLTSARIFKTFKAITISSGVISLFCVFSGLVVSYLYNTPSGASIILINLFMFLLFSFIEKLKSKV